MQLDNLDFGEISPHNCLKTNEALSQKYENINNPSEADVFRPRNASHASDFR